MRHSNSGVPELLCFGTRHSATLRVALRTAQSRLCSRTVEGQRRASGAFSITGNAAMNLTTCGIAVDSTSSSAFRATGNISIQANSINVVGGASEVGNFSITPSPTTNASAVSDPLASVPAPTYNSSHCDYTNKDVFTGNQTVTLSPGTYCGGMAFTGNVNVTFNPGTYILLGGGLNASGNVSLTAAILRSTIRSMPRIRTPPFR